MLGLSFGSEEPDSKTKFKTLYVNHAVLDVVCILFGNWSSGCINVYAACILEFYWPFTFKLSKYTMRRSRM